MHNALRWFLLWTLFPFVIVAADPPPPLVRSVLTTNIPPFGLTGQALFRTANLPYLDWSNIVQQVIDTNAFQPASANLTNWSLISTNALTGKLDSNVWWAAWGSLSTNALTGKLDSNYWFTVWGAIGTNALTAKLDSNWWWTAYGGKVLTNGGAFIGSASGFGTNTTFRGSSDPTGGTILISTNPGYAGSQISVVQGTNNPYVSLTDLDYNGYLMNRNVRTAGRAFSDISSCTSVSNVPIFNAYCSYDATATGYGTDWNHFRGFQARPVWMGSGFVQAIQGFYFQPQTWAPAANVYGVYFDNPLGTNFVTNYVAFWMPQFTATNIINKFGIYFADPTFPSYHAGTWQTGTNIIAGGDFQGLNIISAAAFGTIGVGRGAGIQATPGFYETHLGYLAGRGINNSGIYNTLIGNQSGYTLTANSGNTFLGSYSGYNNNGHSNLFIGRDSGYYETGNNKLFIDNGRHASEADARTKALVYGTFGLSPELQNFSINAKVGVNTNAAAAWLHVTADNSANNVLQVGTTNYPVLMTLGTNGDVHHYPQVTLATNAFEVVGTNGITGSSVVITSGGQMGVGTNLPVSDVDISSTNSNQFQVRTRSIASAQPSICVSSNSNVGLGTNTPTKKLDVQGEIRLVSGGSTGEIVLSNRIQDCIIFNPASSSASFRLLPFGGDIYFENTKAGGGGGLFFRSGAGSGTITPKMCLWINAGSNSATFFPTNYGFLSIGTNSPQSALHVTADNSVPLVAQFGTTNIPQMLVLDTNGNVGIGTNAPTTYSGYTTLDIRGKSGSGGGMVQVDSYDNNARGYFFADTSVGATVIIGSIAGDLVFRSGGAEKMRLNTAGNFGIGTNAPQARLHVTGTNGPSQYIVQVENPMVANATNAFVVKTNGYVGIGVSAPIVPLDMLGTARASAFSVLPNGYFTFSGGNSIIQAANSDYDLIIQNWESSAVEHVRFQRYGNVGIGTNAPQCPLDVIGNNNSNLVLRAGTTNRPTLLTLTTNGVLSVNPGGGLNPVGCYGALMMNATNIVVCAGAASVYTNIAGTGYTTIVTNGFYGDTNGNSSALTNLYAGYYRVQASVSYVGANAGAYEAEVFTNNVSCDLIGWKDTFDTPARLRNGGAAGIIYLPAGCRTSVRIQDGGAGTSIAIQRTSLVIGTP